MVCCKLSLNCFNNGMAFILAFESFPFAKNDDDVMMMVTTLNMLV